ncbi:MOSC domain-containing protein [Chitinimonas sp. BJYL2]|uniref:MOSC domain-containing protein n=1 Tax=Chitinimonas sp. BJYL2 TaxID=2976696 RepID=UPI0022B54D2D|nr:MOSC domain-containing protein [Chitinimonas sp. BJYL2]
MQLTDIYVHPLKSCRGNRLAQATVELMGLQHDRRWMLVDEQGAFITGRQVPRLVQVAVQPDDTGAIFRAAGAGEVRVEIAELTEVIEVGIWRSRLGARTGAMEADFWFSDYLGMSCRLVYVGPESTRRTGRDANVPVAFADGYPLLLIGTASLADLNARLAEPAQMRQFRPNLVIETHTAFMEDGFRRIRIGSAEFENLKPCTRCIFTTVNPDSGELHPARQPLATLNHYRRTADGTMFGINLVPRVLGEVCVGDEVVVLD